MQEHDFDPDSLKTTKTMLIERGHTNVTGIPTGLNPQLGSKGIFVNASISNFDKTNLAEKQKVFENELPSTQKTLLSGSSVAEYTNNTDTSVSYSHNNAKRLLAVHAMIQEPTKNVDLIVLGEKEKNDKVELISRSDYLLAKGFGQVIYQENGKEPEIIGTSNNGGPTYRVIHTGSVTPSESISLRKIGGNFGAGTGDQSFAEAISGSDIVIYKTYSHKQLLADGLELRARDVDPSGKLSRVIKLLTSSATEEEFSELALHLKDSQIQRDLKVFRSEIIKKDLGVQLPLMIDTALQKSQKLSPENPAVHADKKTNAVGINKNAHYYGKNPVFSFFKSIHKIVTKSESNTHEPPGKKRP